MNTKEKLNWLRNFSIVELKNDILPFWRVMAIDRINGGFYGEISNDMEVIPEAPKGLILHARVLWTFSAACQYTKDKLDAGVAGRAYNYLINNFFDEEYGGYFWSLTADGKPLDTKKQIYALAFTIYGFSEYYKISGNKEALQRAIDLFHLVEKHAFDNARNGYIDAFTRDWKEMGDIRLSVKDMNEKKTMNTHLHIIEAYANLYTVWKDKGLADKLENLIRIFLDIIISSSDYHLILFFNENWKPKSTTISYGHDIEAVWLIHESALILGSKEIIREVGQVVPKVTEAALQGLSDIGGLYHEADRDSGRMDHEMEWWPQAEAMVGLLDTFELTGDKKYIDIACNIGQFIQKYLVDSIHGEWFYRVDKSGKPVGSYPKAGFWKCPYHNGRACLEIIKRTEGLT